MQEIQEKFDMTLASIYTLVSKNAIPKKIEDKTVSHSKKHFDIAMAKFNLIWDLLYHYTKYHNIPDAESR